MRYTLAVHMRLVIGVVLAAGCSSPPSKPPHPVEPHDGAGSAVPVPTTAALPAHMVHRSIRAGDGPFALLTTYTLDLDGERATFKRIRQSGPTRGNGPWEEPITETFAGTMKLVPDPRGGSAQVHELFVGEQAGFHIDSICRRAEIEVAGETAMRTPSEDCATLHWVPEATEKVDVLKCMARDDYVRTEAPVSLATSGFEPWTFYFTSPPGIEMLWVKDDCMIGGGFRRVPADGSVARSR